MTGIVYRKRMDGPWHSICLNLTDNEIQEQCLKQKRLGFGIYNKVKIADKNTSIEASAIMFSNGDIWDAALSKFV